MLQEQKGAGLFLGFFFLPIDDMMNSPPFTPHILLTERLYSNCVPGWHALTLNNYYLGLLSKNQRITYFSLLCRRRKKRVNKDYLVRVPCSTGLDARKKVMGDDARLWNEGIRH